MDFFFVDIFPHYKGPIIYFFNGKISVKMIETKFFDLSDGLSENFLEGIDQV